MPENTFADVPSEGQTLDIDKAFERLENKGETTPSKSQPEQKQVQQASQGADNTPDVKPEPFHKHPRWINTQKELKELREKVAKFESTQSPVQQASVETVKLPEWWTKTYGDSQESKERYMLVTSKGGELDWLKENILGELEQRQQQETQQAQQGEEYVETQLAEMVEEGIKFDRNRLLKFMVDFQNEYGSGSLLDSEGNYDFRKSLNLMNRLQPEETPSNDIQKQLAAKSGSKKVSTSSNTGVPIVSNRALRKGNWRDAESGQFVRK